MNAITNEIERALSANLFYLAIVSALTLPDICAALESATGKTNRDRYKVWCDVWLTTVFPNVTSTDLYSLRCGVVHEGKMGHGSSQYDRIIFTLPELGRNIFHGNIFQHGSEQVLNLDATRFCRDMIGAVSRWYNTKQNDPNVVANIPRLVQFHERGLPPYFVGFPVIG